MSMFPRGDLPSSIAWIIDTLKQLQGASRPADPVGGGVTTGPVPQHPHSSPTAGGPVDASVITYTPAVLTDWNGDADPGDADNALNQLAERIDDVEGAAGHAALTIGADGEHSLAGQVLSGVDAAAAQKGHIQLAGELTGTAAEPTVAASHSGSTHSAATDAHIADAVDAHDASAISNVPAGSIAATTVQAAIDELATDYAAADSAHAGAADPHMVYRLESADHSHQSTGAQAGQLDHGLALTGLSDDDHPQYVLAGSANYIDLTDGGATTLHSHTGGSGHTIREDGVDFTARTGLNFLEPDGVLLTDDAGNNETEVNMTLYAKLAGRAGGQTIIGGTAANEDLTLQATSHATRTTSTVRLTTDTNAYMEIGAAAQTFGSAILSIQFLGAPIDLKNLLGGIPVRFTDAGAGGPSVEFATGVLNVNEDIDITGHVAVGAAAISSFRVFNVNKDFSVASATSRYGIFIDVEGTATGSPTLSINALGFEAYIGDSTATTQIAQGIYGFAFKKGANNVYGMYGAGMGIGTASGATGLITTEAIALWIRTVRSSATPTSALTKGIYVDDFSAWGAAGNTVYGFQMDTMDASTAPTRVAIQYGDAATPLWKIDQAGAMFMRQLTAPAAIASMAGVYVDTGGAGGRQRLMCLFESGAAQVLATEP